MSESKDEDLLKIQIISEHCHTMFTNKSSLIVGALIGFLVLFYTLLYGGTFSPLTFWLSFFGWSGVCLYYIRKLSKEHYRNLTKISGMIEKVKQGETLPPLKKLVDSKEKNEDETKQESPVNPSEELSNDAEAWKSQLGALIKKVDWECKRKLFIPTHRSIMALGVVLTGFIVLPFILYSFVLVSDIISTVTATEATTIVDQTTLLLTFVTISLAILTLEFTLGSYLIAFPKTTSEDLANYYYKKLSKTENEENRLYLKALINMKCKEIKISLNSVYEESVVADSDLFSRESLLKSLYSKNG